MPQAKRKQGSNQYSEKYEYVDPADRRLPRKRKKAIKKSMKKLATKGKPFQCPGCKRVNPTGFLCVRCQPRSHAPCPGCGGALLKENQVVCDSCSQLATRTPVGVATPRGNPSAYAPPPMHAPPRPVSGQRPAPGRQNLPPSNGTLPTRRKK